LVLSSTFDEVTIESGTFAGEGINNVLTGAVFVTEVLSPLDRLFGKMANS